MTIDEAIRHCTEVAEENQRIVDTGVVFDDVTIDMLYCDDTEVIEEHLANYQKCASEHRQLAEWLKELKAYKETWNKLGMWLADTRLAIAPDEFLNDVDEELVRVAQVDMIDTVLEWMDKQEVDS